MKNLWQKVNEKIKKECEKLSEKGKRRFLIVLSIVYGICALSMIAQFFLVRPTQLEMKQVKTIEKQTIQTDSLFIRHPTPIDKTSNGLKTTNK